MNNSESTIAVLPGVICMQAITLMDGTTIAFEGDPPALVFAVILKLDKGVKILAYYPTEEEADARMAAEIEAQATATLQ